MIHFKSDGEPNEEASSGDAWICIPHGRRPRRGASATDTGRSSQRYCGRRFHRRGAGDRYAGFFADQDAWFVGSIANLKSRKRAANDSGLRAPLRRRLDVLPWWKLVLSGRQFLLPRQPRRPSMRPGEQSFRLPRQKGRLLPRSGKHLHQRLLVKPASPA